MKRTLCTIGCFLVLVGLVGACSGETAETTEPEVSAEPEESEATAPASLADPEPAETREVQDFVIAWVSEQAADEIFAIPPRGGHEVSGTLADFHTVHQQDEDTYSVCVDFQDGENIYDVDFFVDRAEEGLVLADHYLHKVNGEAVE